MPEPPSPTAASAPAPGAQLGTGAILALTAGSAVVTANAYYIHPIIGEVALSLGVSEARVGLVPALNQIALALGVLLLLPLGDRFSNRAMVAVCVSAQAAALFGMAVLEGFWAFTAASTVLGFFTVTPYLLPAYASKRVPPASLGFVTAMLTTGVVAGILLARLGSGVAAELYGWRSVYTAAAVLMAAAALGLPLVMEGRAAPGKRARPLPYARLIGSTLALARSHPRVIRSGVIQGLGFGNFIATWLGLGLFLTSAEVGLGTDVPGWLAALSVISLVTTPRLGRWADRKGPERARLLLALVLLPAAAGLALGLVWWPLVVLPLLLQSAVGPMIDVTGRMVSLRGDPATRTRLLTLYIVLMFLGGGLGSWAGTAVYGAGGWGGVAALSLVLTGALAWLSWREARRAEDTTGGAEAG